MYDKLNYYIYLVINFKKIRFFFEYVQKSKYLHYHEQKVIFFTKILYKK